MLRTPKAFNKGHRNSVAGQALLELLLIGVIFLFFTVSVLNKVPLTFSKASPYLGGKIQSRLETGSGFRGNWIAPVKPAGGMRDP
jgi:hypothetical protein